MQAVLYPCLCHFVQYCQIDFKCFSSVSFLISRRYYDVVTFFTWLVLINDYFILNLWSLWIFDMYLSVTHTHNLPTLYRNLAYSQHSHYGKWGEGLPTVLIGTVLITFLLCFYIQLWRKIWQWCCNVLLFVYFSPLTFSEKKKKRNHFSERLKSSLCVPLNVKCRSLNHEKLPCQ